MPGMATYAIGDVQGMYDRLMGLLEMCGFDERSDQLWFVGDLVNRGSHSLEVLRYVKELGDAAITILGNHDLHLLALADGVGTLSENPSLRPILDAPDCADLLHWLRHRPLIHREGEWLMTHAGLWPGWSVAQAMALAEEVEQVLRSNEHAPFFHNMYGNHPTRWNDDLTGYDRLRFIVNAMTRMRLISPSGELDLTFTGPPGEAPADYVHWVDAPHHRSAEMTIVCGHWAAQGCVIRPGMAALDSGAIWGGPLTALRREDATLFKME